MSDIDEVKQRVDIVDVVGQYVKLTKSGRTFKGLCPFHSEKSPSFFVYPEQQTWHCFGACNTGGDVFSFVMKKEGGSFGDVLRLLADRTGITLTQKKSSEAEGRQRLYQLNQAAVQYFHDLLLNSPAGKKARSYLASRGVSPEAVNEFQLGYSPNSWDALKHHLLEAGYAENELLTTGLLIETEGGKSHDRFRNLLMFPISDVRGRVSGFGARVLDESMPKYKNSPQTPIFDKSGSLYGINLAQPAIRQQNTAVLVEGYMDVIAAHQYGFSNVVASMGTSVTERQISTIKRLTRNLVLALDADAGGEEAMLRCVDYENSLEAEVKVVVLPQGKDPDEVIKEASGMWQELITEALPVIDYTINMVTSRLDLTTASGKSLAVDRMLPIITEIKDDVRRDHYLSKLAKLTGTSYRNLETALSRIKPDRKTRQPRLEVPARTSQPVWSSPVEEYCLALLLQHPELKNQGQELLPEYFERTENREIFVAYQKDNEPSLINEGIDIALRDHVDYLMRKNAGDNKIEERWNECTLRLREKFLRGLEMKKGQALASAAESGGISAELAELEEQGIESSTQLREVHDKKVKIRSGAREVRNNEHRRQR